MDISQEILTELKNLNQRFDERFDEVDKRFEAIDRRFDEVDKRFEEVDKRLNILDDKIEETRASVIVLENELTKKVNLALEGIESINIKLDNHNDQISKHQGIINNHDYRIVKIEEMVFA